MLPALNPRLTPSGRCKSAVRQPSGGFCKSNVAFAIYTSLAPPGQPTGPEQKLRFCSGPVGCPGGASRICRRSAFVRPTVLYPPRSNPGLCSATRSKALYADHPGGACKSTNCSRSSTLLIPNSPTESKRVQPCLNKS